MYIAQDPLSDVQPDIQCPLCDYNLFGLSESRCPECGHAFDRQELIDRRKRQHPFLFEHHPRRNIVSFFRTLAASILPRRLWRSLRPIHTPAPRRLMLYWILVTLLMLPASIIAPFAPAAQERVMQRMYWRTERPMFIARVERSPADRAQAIRRAGSVEAYVDSFGPRSMPLLVQFKSATSDRYWRSRAVLPFAAALLLWPWLTAMTLLIFRRSLRQARIDPAHVLRCVVYSADWTMLLLGPLLVVAAIFIGWSYYGATQWLYSYDLDEQAPIAIALALLLLTYRLACAYRLYLRFRHAILTVIASQVMVGLVLLKLMYVWWHGTWG